MTLSAVLPSSMLWQPARMWRMCTSRAATRCHQRISQALTSAHPHLTTEPRQQGPQVSCSSTAECGRLPVKHSQLHGTTADFFCKQQQRSRQRHRTHGPAGCMPCSCVQAFFVLQLPYGVLHGVVCLRCRAAHCGYLPGSVQDAHRQTAAAGSSRAQAAASRCFRPEIPAQHR